MPTQIIRYFHSEFKHISTTKDKAAHEDHEGDTKGTKKSIHYQQPKCKILLKKRENDGWWCEEGQALPIAWELRSALPSGACPWRRLGTSFLFWVGF